MLTMVEVQVKTSIFLHFQTFLLVKMIYKKKNRAFSLLGGRNEKGGTWAGVFAVTGDGDSLTFGSLGDAAEP